MSFAINARELVRRTAVAIAIIVVASACGSKPVIPTVTITMGTTPSIAWTDGPTAEVHVDRCDATNCNPPGPSPCAGFVSSVSAWSIASSTGAFPDALIESPVTFGVLPAHAVQLTPDTPTVPPLVPGAYVVTIIKYTAVDRSAQSAGENRACVYFTL